MAKRDAGDGGHSHGHGSHSHAGPQHGHAHGGEHAAVSRNQSSPLERGAGRGKILFFDAPSGLAGDMVIAALLDLGVPFAVVEEVLERLGLEGATVAQAPVVRGAVGATHFSVSWPETGPERSYRQVRELLASSKLDSDVLDLSLDIFRRLAEAESEVHRIELDSVSFHEVGAVDSIVDIVGAAACLRYLQATVLCSPLPVGSGSIRCQHGVLPLPAPATINCLIGVPTYAVDSKHELVTPTGAAIVATVAQGFTSWPSFSPLRVGWGAGSRDDPERVNALRATLGTPAPLASLPEQASTHTLVETTLDDMSGELAGHALAQMLAAGALDAWATPVLMKKGRPGLILSAICQARQASQVADAMLQETSSIGVRFTQLARRELPRRTLLVETEFGSIPVKLSGEGGAQQTVKPEFDVCAQAARAHGVAVRVVIERAQAAVRALLG